MNSKLDRQLNELLTADIITSETAVKITAFYNSKEASQPNRLFTIFGVLGALLSGLGIILIIAHNWDTMPRNGKTLVAFLPLLIGQIACAFSMIKKKSITWIEASTTFLILSVGATISLVSQVYNIPGNLSSFLLVWIAITAPLMYLMRSKIALILHLVLSTWYACDLGYFYNSEVPWWYLLQFAWGIPFYIDLQRKEPESNLAGVFNWLMPLSLVIALGTFTRGNSLGFVLYVGLFGLCYNFGQLPFFKHQKLRRNGLTIIGSLGTVFVALLLTFKWFWKDAINDTYSTIEISITIVLFMLSIAVLAYLYFKKQIQNFNLFQYVFLIVGVLYIIRSIGDDFMMVLMNILVAALGLFAVRIGVRKSSYGILNYGLVIITALIVCRFFDTNIDFIVRGFLFIAVGGGFFFANYLLLKKQRRTAKNITPNSSRNE